MELIPVIDLMQGVVVRGVAGRRELYRPNSSCLLNSSDPIETCRALMGSFQPQWLYVADLDGITQGAVQSEILTSLVDCGVALVVDAGVATRGQAVFLADLGASKIIVSSESVRSMKVVEEVLAELGPERVVFSLDLHDGNVLGDAFSGKHPVQVVSECHHSGIHQLIVLELSRIGTNRGVPTGSLCHSIKERWNDLVVWTGGGANQVADLHRLLLNRVDGVMIASALHDGRITPTDWKAFETLDIGDVMLAMDA
jgi:phosphoribosylformimino-5-aminoimidazole carboxamide ribotide isomerase